MRLKFHEITMVPSVKLNNDVEMPIIGLGVFKSAPGEETMNAVKWALEAGYRHIDTAQYYQNEHDVGFAISNSGIPQEEIFVTSKLSVDNFGYDSTMRSFDESMQKLRFEQIDLFLLHWPVHRLRLESWKALEEIHKSGRTKAIGVSNFTIPQLEELLDVAKVIPAVNQVEFSAFLYQQDLLEFCQNSGIQLEAYTPLTRGRKLEDSRLVEIAGRYKKSPAQILIRWCIQHDVVVIPKSVHKERIVENFNVFDFEISATDMKLLDALDEGFRTSWNPEDEEQVKFHSKTVIAKIGKGLSKLGIR